MDIIKTCTGMRLYGYEPESCKRLEWKTSIFNKNTHKREPSSGFYDEKTKTFVTYNMTNNEILTMLANTRYNEAKITAGTPRMGKRMESGFHTNITLTDIQQPILQEIMYNKSPEVFINLPTAVGKTVVAVQYVSYMQVKSMILCYKNTILNQWKTTFLEKTDIDPSRITTVEDSRYLYEVAKGNVDTSDIDIWLTTPSMIATFGETYGWDLLADAFLKMGIGLKIIDEAHRHLTTTIKVNAWTNIAHTVYLSADFNQASYEKRRQFFDIFKFVPVVRLDDNVMKDLKHIVAVEYRYNSHPDEKDILTITNGKKGNRYKWNHFEFTKYEQKRGVLTECVTKIIEHIVKTDTNTVDGKPYKILVLTNMINVVDDMYSIISCMGTGRTVGRYHGKVSKEEAKSATSADIIISTYQAFSIGVDVISPNFRHVISMCPVDYITANQAAGRNRPIAGMNSFFWMPVDRGFDYCVNNSIKVLKYLSLSRVGEIKCIEGG